MSRIVSILRAAHCRSTHHYFAIDALDRIPTPTGQRLGALLLKYHDEYLVGAKAPDKNFRDFQNHVIHVQDNHWGGAPESCEEWLAKSLEHLNRRQWKKAAYACGVLSHYFTDPLMPLHTAQCDQESIVHRPLEWSICKSYDAILAEANLNATAAQPPIGSGDDWIQSAVIEGAQIANRHYARLIELYDVQRGCKNPPEGLNAESRRILADLFALAINGWGACLARIADHAAVDIPECSLTLTTLLATIDMPLAWVVRRISDASEQYAVQAILKEYQATGTLQRHLPAEVRHVTAARAEASPAVSGAQSSTMDLRGVSPHTHSPTKASQQAASSLEPETVREPASAPRNRSLPVAGPQTSDPVRAGATVNLESELVDAPSIGPKTARRFEKIGITTIGQFLSADCRQLQRQLDTGWITDNLLCEWQDQARLVCAVPALCGYKAQLLVASDVRSAEQLAASNSAALYPKIVQICDGIDGKRILRSSSPPSSEDVDSWIASAQHKSFRAA